MQCNVKMFQNSSQKHAAFQLFILMGHFHMYAAYEMKFRIQSSNPDRVSSRSGASERRGWVLRTMKSCVSLSYHP